MGGERPEEVPAGEGQHDSHQRHRGRGGTDLEHRLEVGLQSDLEEEQDDAQPGEEIHRVSGEAGFSRHQVQQAGAQHDAGQQLSQDGGLAKALAEFAE